MRYWRERCLEEKKKERFLRRHLALIMRTGKDKQAFAAYFDWAFLKEVHAVCFCIASGLLIDE